MITLKLRALGSSAVWHVLVVISLLSVTSAGRRPARKASATAMTVFVVAPPQDAEFAGLNPIDRGHDDTGVERGDTAPRGSIGPFTFDIEKIRARATLLFPFVTPGLALDYFALAAARPVADAFHDPSTVQTRTPTAQSHVTPPLVISNAA